MFPFPAVQEIFFPHLQGTQNDPGVNLSMFIGNRLDFAVDKKQLGPETNQSPSGAKSSCAISGTFVKKILSRISYKIWKIL
jgi:hypothetical protein